MTFFRLNASSGVPLYVQLMEQVKHAVETGALRPGDQLPTIRALAQELVMNSNTVVRAYRELEYDGLLETHQGTGTFISEQKIPRAGDERQRQLGQIVSDAIARAGAAGFTVQELLERLRVTAQEPTRRR